MYNGKVVKALLAAKGLKGTQLSNYLFGDPRRSLTPLCNEGLLASCREVELLKVSFVSELLLSNGLHSHIRN